MLKKYAAIVLTAVCLFSALPALADSTSSLLRDNNDPVVGNKNGTTTVVEFFDYRCSHCVNEAPTVDALIKANPDIRFVFKELPVFGAASEQGARAALAANIQGKYYPFHLALITRKTPLNDELIASISKELNLDLAKLKKDMNSTTVSNEITSTYKLAREIGVKGTPAFYIGKTNAKSITELTNILGEVTMSQFNEAIHK